jgi:hypothetical protein
MATYLAAAYGRKEEIKQYRDVLVSLGEVVTASWLEEPHGPQTKLADLTPGQNAQYASVDFLDILASETLVFFSESKLTPRGGRHVEMGIAIGLGRAVHVIGTAENIFHYLPFVRVFANFEDYLKFRYGVGVGN